MPRRRERSARAALIALRQRELGMVDEGYLAAAQELSSGSANLPAWIAGTLDVADVLPPSIGGVSRPPSSDADLEKIGILGKNGAAYTALLKNFSEVDELSAYAWASYACGSIEMRDVKPSRDFRGGLDVSRHAAPRVQGRRRAAAVNGDGLLALTSADPRFIETDVSAGAARQSDSASSTRRTIQFDRRLCLASAMAGADALDRQRRDDRRGVRAGGAVLRRARWRSSRAPSTRCSARRQAR